MEFKCFDKSITPKSHKGDSPPSNWISINIKWMYSEIEEGDLDTLKFNEPNMFYGASNLIFENAKHL